MSPQLNESSGHSRTDTNASATGMFAKRTSIVLIVVLCLVLLALFTALLCMSKIGEATYFSLTALIFLFSIAIPSYSRIKMVKLGDKFQIEMSERIQEAEKRLNKAEDALRKIIAYRPGHFAHQALCQIRDKANEYYNDSNSHKKRLLLFLLDDGYLQPPRGSRHIKFSDKCNGKRLCDIAELTPMAKLLLQLRDEESRR